jgi:DNA polymerase-3 subunit gamma/tau
MCKLNEKGDLIDLIEVDAASNRGIDEIRDLREKINFAPTRAKSKVYIIDEVHMLTKEAFNALLKSLEEPPAHVYFVLATTEIHKIPETILSRCQRYDFKRITERDIVERLKMIAKKEGFEVEIGALELLAKYADGGLRDAISLLEQFSTESLTVDLVNERLGLTSHQSCDELYGALGSADTKKGLDIIESLHKDGYDLQQFTTAFLGLLRGKLHEALAGGKQAVVPKLLGWIDLFDEAWMKLKRASISQLPLEIAVIRATHTVEAKAVEAKAEEAPIMQTEQPKREGGLVTFESIKKQLPKVLEGIAHPSVRQSFASGHLKDLKGKVLRFVFSSKFHYDKVHAANAVVEIEAAFQKLMGADVKVICELDEKGNAPKSGAEVDTLGWDTVEESL